MKNDSDKSSGVKNDSKEPDNSVTCAWLAYILVGIVWYYADENLKKDPYVKYHVKQAIVLFIFSIIWAIVLGIIESVLFLSLVFIWPVFIILNYVPLILAILGIINALNKKEKGLPIIGGYANKLSF